MKNLMNMLNNLKRQQILMMKTKHIKYWKLYTKY